MNKKTLLNFWVLLLCMVVGGASTAWGDTYEQLTSIADIDESAEYVLGIDGTGFHYQGTSSWGLTALPSAQTPLKYTLTKANDGKSFTAKTTIGNTTYYLQVPTSNTFSMATSTGTNTDIIIGTTQVNETNYAVANKTTTARHLRVNGTSGLRSYAGTTGTMAFFYKVVADVPAFTITAQSNNDSWGTVSLSGSVITATPADGYTYAEPAYTVDPANSATVVQNGNAFTVTPSENTTVTINFEALPVYTVTLGDDSSELTEESYGAGVKLPVRSTLNGYEFAGWSETNVSSETTTAPTIIPAGDYEPTANITLYPVYTKVVGGGGTSHESTSVTISDYAAANKWLSGTKYSSVTLDENITATASGTKNNGNTGKYYTNGESWRIYSSESGKLILNASNGAELTSATISFSNSTLSYGGENITSGSEVSLSGSSAQFSAGGTTYITAISVNYDITGAGTTYYWSAPIAAAVEMPNIVVAENPFLFSTTATITCETEGAAIKYSFDNETWNDYSSALNITATTTIYAKATKGNDESSVAQVTATKNLAETTVTVSGDLTLDLKGETNVEAGTLTAAVIYNEEAVEGAVVTWTSSNTDVAVINETTGAVTIKTTGDVTFTATYAGNSDYAEATGTKSVTIIDSKAPGSEGNPYTVAQAITAIQALPDNKATSDKYYVSGVVSAFYGNATGITSSSNKRYYISDDGTTENQLLVYNGNGLDNVAFSSDDDLLIGDRVTIYGAIQNYQGNTPEIASGNYIVSRTELPASDLTKTGDITLDYKNGAIDADLTKYFTTSSTGAITYTVADETVIENADELISALKVGTTTVTVSQAATLSYKAGEIVINVTVQDTREDATTIPAINIETLKVNDVGTLSVTNPVKADEGVTFSFASSNDNVLMVENGEYMAQAVGTVTVTVTATPNNTNLYKPVVANFEVTVEADVKTDTEILLDADNGSTVYGTPKSVDFTVTENYDGKLSYVISNGAIADVEIGASAITFTPKAVGTAVITISAPATASFNAAESVQYTLTVTAPEGGTEAVVASETLFSETFDECDGTGGNDDKWSSNIASSTLTADNKGWEFTNGSGASKCAKFGTGNNKGSAKTPAIGGTGTLSLSFRAAAWNGNSEGTTLKISVSDGNIDKSSVTLTKGEFNTYTATITNATAETTITFEAANASNNRFFLDDVLVEKAGASIQATLNAYGYATFCSQYPLDFSAAKGYTAWQVKSISGEVVTFEKINGTIKGGQGILLKGEADATVTLASDDSEVMLNGNLLFGTTAPTYVDNDEYLGLSGNKFVKVNAGTIPAGKALLPVSALPAGARQLTFQFEDDGQTTGISEQITVNGEKSVYDLQGRKVEKTTKGLYIVNGRKVVVK